MTHAEHPAPRRDRVNFALLGGALVLIPGAWGLRLVLNYALDSYFCFPDHARRFVLPHGAGWVWPTLLGLDLASLVLAAALAVLGYRGWQRTRDERAVGGVTLLDVGEGRTRFFALWGLLIGIGTVAAICFDLVALWVVPQCG